MAERELAAAAPGQTSEQRWVLVKDAGDITRAITALDRPWPRSPPPRWQRTGRWTTASWPDVDAFLVALATLSILTQALNCRPCSHLQPHRPELRKP